VIVSTMLENSSGLPNALLFAGCLIIYSTNKGGDEKNDRYENHNDDPDYANDAMMLTKYEKTKPFFFFFFPCDKV